MQATVCFDSESGWRAGLMMRVDVLEGRQVARFGTDSLHHNPLVQLGRASENLVGGLLKWRVQESMRPGDFEILKNSLAPIA